MQHKKRLMAGSLLLTMLCLNGCASTDKRQSQSQKAESHSVYAPEGFVLLEFDINDVGGVENIRIIKSNPEKVFDKDAVKALKNWKYEPKVIDGKAVWQYKQRVQLDFSLEAKPNAPVKE